MHAPLTSLDRRSFLSRSAALVGAAWAGGALGLAGCQTAGAQLVFAGWQGEDDASAAQPFLTKSGTRLRSTYVASGDELLTKLRSGGIGLIDVVSQNKDYVPLAIANGFLEPLDLARIPNAASLFPVLANAPWARSEDRVYALPLTWGGSPIIWDPKKWDGPPARYSDLADVRYRGALTCLDDPYSVLWLLSSSLGHPDPARLTSRELDDTLKLALAVKKNLVLIGSFGDATDVIIRGDASMAFSGWELMVNIAAEKGRVLRAAAPAIDKGFLWADAYSIVKDAPNRDHAYAFIDQMLSPEADAILALASGSAAANRHAVARMAGSPFSYDYGVVERRGPHRARMDMSVLPPIRPEGDIVGISAWRRAWQEFKA